MSSIYQKQSFLWILGLSILVVLWYVKPLPLQKEDHSLLYHTYEDNNPAIFTSDLILSTKKNSEIKIIESSELVYSPILSLSYPSQRNDKYQYVIDDIPKEPSTILNLYDLNDNISDLYIFNTQYYDYVTDKTKCATKINLLTQLIDKNNCLTANAIENLELVEFDKIQVHKVIYEDLDRLIKDASESNLSIKVISGFRDIDYQEQLNNDFEKLYGEALSEKVVAPPGHSEHHLGTAVDFTSDEIPPDSNMTFEQTEAFDWVIENGWKYGFVLSYPRGKEEVTGYMYEPWHWRYIGREHAKRYNSVKENLTLVEYLDLFNQAEIYNNQL